MQRNNQRPIGLLIGTMTPRRKNTRRLGKWVEEKATKESNNLLDNS
ncbi:MAG: hypothetical protein AB1487_05685 [Thermodesulfobacteriota bacterium]